MRSGLLKAALVLGPALVLGADAASSRPATERIPSAIVSVQLPPTEARNDDSLIFRLDIEESTEACGTPSIRLNGVAPGEESGADDGQTFHVGLRTAQGVPAGVGVVRYEAECISWGGQAQEQQVRFRLESVDGTPVSTDAAKAAAPLWTARIRQVAPARIVDIEGAAGVMLLGSYYGEDHAEVSTSSSPSSSPSSSSSASGTSSSASGSSSSASGSSSSASGPSSSSSALDPSQLAAWQASIDALGRQIAILRHDMRMRRLYMAQTFDLTRAVADVAATQQPQDLHAVLGLAWDKLAAKTKKLLLGATGINAVDGYWPSCGGPYNESVAQGRPPPLPASWIVQQPLTRKVATEAETAGDAELTTWPEAPYSWWDLGPSVGGVADSGPNSAATSSPEESQTDAADDEAQAMSKGHPKQQQGFFESLFQFVVFSVIFVSLTFVISRRCARRRIRRDRERLLSGENDRSSGEGGYGGEGGRSDGALPNDEDDGQGRFQRFRTSGRPSAARFSARLRDISQRFSERRTLRAAIREARRTRRQHQRQLRNSQPSAAKEFFIKAYRFLFRSMGHSEKLTRASTTATAEAEAVAAAARRLEAGEASLSGLASGSSSHSAAEDVRPTVIANGHIEVPVPPTVGRTFVRNVNATPAPARSRDPAPTPSPARAPARAPAPAPAAAYVRDLSPPPRRQPRTFDYARDTLPANAYVQTASPPRSRSPSPTPEQVIASFRAAADVVGQMLAAEEGRAALTQTAEAWRRKDDREEPQEMAAAAAAAPRHQLPPRGPLTASKATSYAVPRAGYGGNSQSGSSQNNGSNRRDTLFDTNSDFDDTESLPPAYSEQAFSYDDVPASAVVADGFQYQRSAQ